MFDIFYINNKPNIKSAKQVCSVEEAMALSRTRYLWVVDGANDYCDFDFTWEPLPWESNQTHIWASQWQQNGGTYLIPNVDSQDTNHRDSVVKRDKVLEPFIYLDFNNTMADSTYQLLSSISNDIIKTRFISSYHGTLARVINKVESEFVWITTSICDYSKFDFTWHPSVWHKNMLHVFHSNEQKFGDTFYIHVPTFKRQIKNIQLLEWYDTIHFVSDIIVPRHPIPYEMVSNDSIVDDIKQCNFIEPYVLFTNTVDEEYQLPTPNLWREKTRTVIPLSNGGNTALVPRDAKNHILTQVYDYPYITKSYINYCDVPLDIIFISNGESMAERNWQHLLNATKGITNTIHRVSNVDGRVNAYHQAAKLSNTAWFFAVFAKLEVNVDFDWNWQPDRLQQPKHYIFHALNPITGLEYGHMAIIAQHTQLMLSNTALGLDFSLDQEHTVVPVLSGTAQYADSISTAWRTAFREVIKLRDKNGSVVSEYRLQKWLDSSDTEFGIWSQRGAKDAIEYYNDVNGEFDKLRLTYEWKWLSNHFSKKYPT
jgi:hypothetical protein